MRDAVLVLLVAGVAYVIYKMTKGDDASPQPLGELAELSDTAKELAASNEVGQFVLSSSSSLVRPRVTFEERVRIAGQGDASLADGDTSSSASDLPGLEGGS